MPVSGEKIYCMQRFYNCCFFILLLILFPDYSFAKDKTLIGWIEKVRIYPGDIEFKAKMDTGALTSSINAKNITEFEKDGEEWVRFDIVNKKNISTTLELPLVREAKIKRHFGKTQKRHVVLLGICLGKLYKETQVNLVDRHGFLYAMLIGRSFLRKDFVIDPAEQFTSSPKCLAPGDA